MENLIFSVVPFWSTVQYYNRSWGVGVAVQIKGPWFTANAMAFKIGSTPIHHLLQN